MRSNLLFASTWLLFVLLLSVGCNQSTETDSPSPFIWYGQSDLASESEPTELEAWILIESQQDWPAQILVQAAEATTGYPVKLKIIGHNVSNDSYIDRITEAVEAGNGPDIIYFHDINLAFNIAEAGYLAPLENCRTRYGEFENANDSFWERLTWRNSLWAVPLAVEARPLFFNKDLLKSLGWSPEQVEDLPIQIERGEFSLDDLISTAKEAISVGLIEPDFGLWQRPGDRFLYYYQAFGGRIFDPAKNMMVVNQKSMIQAFTFQRQLIAEDISPHFVLDRNQNTWSSRAIWHDTVIHNRVLFWFGSGVDWKRWANTYVEHLGGENYLNDAIGYTLLPSGFSGNQGLTFLTLKMYAITNELASGHQVLNEACAVLAQTLDPAINGILLSHSSHLGVIKSEMNSPLVIPKTQFVAGTEYMLNYGLFLPNHHEINMGALLGITSEISISVNNGDISPEEATAETIRQLNVVPGTTLIVE